MHYVTQGEGPLVVLLHGFPEFWYSWRHQIPVLAERFRVVAPDMRGYNETDKPEGVEQYQLLLLIGDIAGLIEALGEKRAVVVGHDWGGGVAWAVAMHRPDVVERLIVLNAPHLAIFQQHILKNPRQSARSWYMFFFQLPAVPEKLLSLNNYAFIRRAFEGVLQDAEIDKYVEAISKPGALTGGINYYRANVSQEFILGALGQPTAFPQIKAPTLLVWGEDDAYLGLELTEGVEVYIDAPYTLRRIPGCSHWVQQQKPELVNQYILEFLRIEDRG
ncbi:MAG: alpha/beta hydrolase [Acidobacteria bacterium]|nr:alpha/beta hydrolase [Acidobacteriota bacterium]